MQARTTRAVVRACQVEFLEQRLFLTADPPTSLTASPVYFEDTTLNWVAPSSGAPDQYRVYMSENNQIFSILDTTPGTILSYIHHDILTGAGQRRHYRVTAFKNGEESAPTPSVYPLTAQDNAVQISADVSLVGDGRLTISWQPNPRFTSFEIFSRQGATGVWESRDTITETSWTDTEDIQENQLIEYRVVAISGSGAGATGYIMTGANLALTESRGTALLVVDQTKVEPLAPQLARLKRDLMGVGWKVGQIAVERMTVTTRLDSKPPM